jgi:hypothetical protein
MLFEELLQKSRKGQPQWLPPSRLLALDPGETCGYALFILGKLQESGQQPCGELPAKGIQELFDKYYPTHVVAEDYRIYQHKTDSHTWSSLFTPRLLGMIELLCYQKTIKLEWLMASTHKGFCTDTKLRDWGLWLRGKQHARDAVRIGCFHLLFSGRTLCKRNS